MANESIALISLGCAKNLVNSEQMLCLLSDAGYAIAPDPDGADAVIINTCGFIDAAKSEAIDNILEMAELKAAGRLTSASTVIEYSNTLPSGFAPRIFAVIPSGIRNSEAPL